MHDTFHNVNLIPYAIYIFAKTFTIKFNNMP